MGYAGYSPGNVIADKKSPLEQALRALPLGNAQETLELIDKLIRNVVRNPADEKFRRIKLSNPKIAAAITNVPFAVDALKEMGWVEDADGLVLPESVRPVHETEVLAIIAAKDHYKKEAEEDRRRKLRESKPVDDEKKALLEQTQRDRAEKAAEGPVTQGSKAQKLGEGSNIMRAGDIGIGKGGGG